MANVVNIDAYIGQEFTLEEFCLLIDKKLLKDYQKLERQIRNVYDLVPTGVGRGKKKRFILNGYVTLRSSTGRLFDHEVEKDIILRDFLFTIDDSVNSYLNLKESNGTYDYIINSHRLLYIFGYHNEDYKLTSGIFKISPTDSKELREMKKILLPMRSEVKLLIKFFANKKKGIGRLLSANQDYIQWNKTFWAILKSGETLSADRLYNIPTKEITEYDVLPFYIDERKEEIDEESEQWEKTLYSKLDKNSKNPFIYISGVTPEKEKFVAWFDRYCRSISRIDQKSHESKEYELSDVNPYANAFRTKRLPNERPEKEKVKTARMTINNDTIEELVKFVTENNANTENIKYLIDNYVRLKE